MEKTSPERRGSSFSERRKAFILPDTGRRKTAKNH